MQKLDEYIIANERSRHYILTPKQIACRNETLAEIVAVLNACTEQQRQRFLLYALDSMSYAEIGLYEWIFFPIIIPRRTEHKGSAR